MYACTYFLKKCICAKLENVSAKKCYLSCFVQYTCTKLHKRAIFNVIMHFCAFNK